MTTPNNPQADKLLYHLHQLSTYIATPHAKPSELASARYHCEKATEAARAPLSDDMVERLNAMCAKIEADAVSALHYIERRYGRLEGVGWDRVFDAHEELSALGRTLTNGGSDGR